MFPFVPFEQQQNERNHLSASYVETSGTSVEDEDEPDTLDSASDELTSLIRMNNGNLSDEDEQEILKLCRKFPPLAYASFLYSYGLQVYPLSFLICCGASFEIVKLYCNEHPNSLLQRTNLGYYPLHFACENSDATHGVIAYLVNEYPPAASKEKLDRRQLPIHMLLEREHASLDDVESLINAYPDCMIKRDNNGLTPVAHAFAGPNSLEVMEYIIHSAPNSLDYFQLFHIHNQTLNLDRAKALSMLLPKLKHFNLGKRNIRLQVDATEYLMQALGENTSITHLILSFGWVSNKETCNQAVGSALQRALASIPNLVDLEVYGNDWTEQHSDLTESLAALISKSRLKFITVKKFLINHERMFQALADNTSVQRFDVISCVNDEQKRSDLAVLLENDNATLQHVSLNTYGGGSATYDRIHYLVELNHLGRAKARDPSASQEEFLCLLWDVIQNRQGVADEKPLRFLYGLLRECPGIWCGLERS